MAEFAAAGIQPFRILKHLGDGGYGSVDLVDHDQWGIVAYKKSTGSPDSRVMDEWRGEASRHRDLRHPNIVAFYGGLFDSTCCGIFVEYMRYGSVDNFLNEFKVSSEWRTKIIHEVASAMSYLHQHTPVIIHGDLSSQNVLIGDTFLAKVADFGLARVLKENYSNPITETPLKGKVSYIAPEYFVEPRKRKSEKFDVYSFAISAWEILSQKEAYSDFSDRRLIRPCVERGERPRLGDLDLARIPTSIQTLIAKSWHQKENKRPTFKIIETTLKDHISRIQPTLSTSYASLIEQEQNRSLSMHTTRCGVSSTVDSTEEFGQVIRRPADIQSMVLSSHTMNHVRGVASLKEELFIVYQESRDVDVYNIHTSLFKRKIRVDGLTDPGDIVADSDAVYVSEYGEGRIHRIQLAEGKIHKNELAEEGGIHRIQLADECYFTCNWLVACKYCNYMKLSVSKEGNIVTCCWDSDKIYEYTSFGKLLREIKIYRSDWTIRGLQHALHLDSDRFLICHMANKYNRVCVIDSRGKLLHSYGGEPGSGIGQLDFPSYLATDRNGFIFVADSCNHRIIQLNSSLEFVKEFVPATAGLKNPCRLHINIRTKQLYTSELEWKNITIFDL